MLGGPGTLKVLIDGRCLKHAHADGVQRHARALTDELARLRLPFDLAVPDSTGRWGQQIWEHLTLPRRARGYDVLYCPSNVAPLWMPPSTRLVVTLHCLRFLRLPETYRRAFRTYYRLLIPRVVRRADAILTVSRDQKREIARQFPHAARKIHAIPLGVDPRHAPSAKPREPMILFVGNLTPSKNLPRLLDAFARIAPRVPQRLCVVGEASSALKAEGDLAEVMARIPTGRVEWLGQISDEKLLEMYQRAQLMVFPSLHEGFGLPPLEAMACGTPVLVSEIPALRELVADAGDYVDPHDVTSIARGMEELLTRPQRRADLSGRAVARAGLFTWKRCAEATYDVLREVAGTHERSTNG